MRGGNAQPTNNFKYGAKEQKNVGTKVGILRVFLNFDAVFFLMWQNVANHVFLGAICLQGFFLLRRSEENIFF